MHGTAELSQMDSLTGDQFIHGEFSCFWRAEDCMVIRINCLGDAKVYAALAHSFQITIKTFVPGKEQADHAAGSIINGTVESISGLAAEPFERCRVNLDELSGMGFAFPPVGTVTDFFLFGAVKTCVF